MTDNFNASLVINTAASEAGIRRLDSAAKDLDKTLQLLHKSLKNGQGDLDRVSSSMTTLTRANAALIRSEQDRAKATVLAAKADGITIVNQGKRAKTARELAIADAKVAKIRQATVTAGQSGEATTARRDAVSRSQIAATEALAQARVTTEVVRTTTAQANLAAATTRAGSASEQAAARTARLEGASRSAQSGTLALNDSLSNSRYLLYDVGQTYTVLALALQAIPLATAAVAIAYERDFAQVIRTNDTLQESTGKVFAALRDDLKALATEIPLSFSEFANIATIGGQLGIQGGNIEAFTETVARFGAASNVSLDQASTAFGRLQNSYDPLRKDGDFFNKIGSAIAYVGVKSAATETEIIAVNNQISAAGAQFGFAADEIVGLSGALASVRIRPELARGAFQRIMLGLSRSADEGAESFDKFGKYTGLAAEESVRLFKSNPSEFFYKYVGGIKAAIKETGSVSSVLDDIGAKNVFDKQFILGLSQGYEVFGQALNNSSKAFEEGSFLKESTQGVFETMDAKLKRIANSFKNISDSIAKGSVGGGLSTIADTVLGVANAADRLLQAAPGIAIFINVLLGLGSAVGILLAFKAAQAFTLAGLVGFQQVLGKGTLAAGLTAKGILQQVAVTMLMAKGVSQAHAQALVVQAGAFRTMGMSASTAAAQVAAANATAGAGVTRSLGAPIAAMTRFGGAITGAGRAALGLVGGPIGALLIGLGAIAIGFVQAEEKANAAGDSIARAMSNGARAGKQAIADALTDRTVDSWITDVGSGGFGNHGKNARKIAEDVGIAFEDIVNSISKGEDATKDFTSVLDGVAAKKGFKDFADLQAKSFTNLDNNKGELQFLLRIVEELGAKSAESKEDIDAVKSAVDGTGEASASATPDVEGLADGLEGAGDSADTAAQKLDKFLGAVFGIVDAAGGTQAALQNLGEGLASSTNFGPGTEGGRENVNNFREALKAAATEQQVLIDTTNKSTQQAAADYIAFVEGLVSEMASRGVDPAKVAALADQAKTYFGNALVAGPQPVVEVGVKPESAQAAALETVNLVQNWFNSNPLPALSVDADGTNAVGKVKALHSAIAEITGLPYEVVVDALTDPAHENAREVEDLLIAITTGTYVAPVDVDVSNAVANIQSFVAFARTELAKVQTAANGGVGYGDGDGSMSPEQKAQYGAINAPRTYARTSTPSRVRVPQVKLSPSGGQDFNSLANGYDKVASEASKAGDAGKKAGEDMADGISDATRAANDYANRLKTGLQSAFDMQYGVQKATDDYHTALNSINKKREDELKSIEDLITAQKELNDARNTELINARKAGNEKNISLKYGEGDRAADYAAQEQEALNSAAAKQKEIEANKKQSAAISEGIGKLDGFSQAAIDNRTALRDLEAKTIDMVVAYANTGASVDQVRAYAAQLNSQFKLDVTQMGYNQSAVGLLQGSLERYIGVVNSVPLVKPTSVEADTAAATGAFNALDSLADAATEPRKMTVVLDTSEASRQLRSIEAQIKGSGTGDDPTMTAFRPGTFKPVLNAGGIVPGFARGGHIGGTPPSNKKVDNLRANVQGGGQIGVRSGEFITQEPAVKFWGLDFMNAINNMKMPMFNGGGSIGGGAGGGGNGSMVVALDADTLAFLASLQQDIKLYADSKELASAVNRGNRQLVAEGMNK